MAVPTTWALLQAEIATWAVRDDLTDQIPNFIGYAENRFNRDLFTPDRHETATLTATTGSVALPTDFWGVRAVYVDGSTNSPLEALTIPELRATYQNDETGTPRHYAIEGGFMLLGPAPSGSTEIELTYWETIPALGSGQATNWLLTAHPDLYLAASLEELFSYTRDLNALALWSGKTAARIESLNKAGIRNQFSGPLRSRAGKTDQILSFIR